MTGRIKIRIRIPPERVYTLENELIEDRGHLVVSEFVFETDRTPIEVGGRTIINEGYKGVLFEFVKENYEIIEIYDRHGDLTGYYCNVNTKPERFEGGYAITDLFLDLWVFPNLEWHILDEDEFEIACNKGWLSKECMALAKRVLKELIEKVNRKDFPPKEVRDFREPYNNS